MPSRTIDYLESLGFARPTPEGSPEVALINQATGFILPCDWLDLNRIDLGFRRGSSTVDINEPFLFYFAH